MEQKTKVHAEEGRSDLLITREFDLPLDLLFKAYQDPEIVEQWMGTKVLKLENKKHGSWQFQTSDAKGNILFSANGTIHEFVENKRIVRTFEMDNAGFEVQLEFLEFEAVSDDTSRLNMHIVYRSNAHRDEMLKLPFAYGINMAHDQLQKVVSQLK
ncbi:MAG: ATPase [Sphingobacteriales bacterium SCN 48-20]|uniref:SRPBCC domain-containing protein n=1 Tax=Terrimonas ferruginea TaxID=249 RepID=UPI0008695024|nr:SRPBCC domain-containing protein [Terrimonas ferruginea]MBN8784967.1 SRPBCC domain-containing protein [Terrimonas ferruginea]ODT95936.1 MAG: ATPase [Sphingobacteriales bacterium SCN 48-20]OJW44393.1 MAG: ATPase [Sphingobacteriales bacterium 48-107]